MYACLQGSWVWIDDGMLAFVRWASGLPLGCCFVLVCVRAPPRITFLAPITEAEVYLPAKVTRSFRPGEVGDVEMEDGKVRACAFGTPSS